MQADLSRDSFDKKHDYTRVLFQQGRVPLDADLNEQTAILLYRLRCLAEDLMGPDWGPSEAGFKPTLEESGLKISKGRYYVNGLMCEWHEDKTPYTTRVNRTPPYFVYLEAHEQHLNAYEAGEYDSHFTDPAFAGLDPSTRSRVVWAPRAIKVDGDLPNAPGKPLLRERWLRQVGGNREEREKQRGGMAALLGPKEHEGKGDCATKLPGAYRGEENQLLRVEIHQSAQDGITFKWARDNGSAYFPVRKKEYQGKDNTLTLDLDLADCEARTGLQVGDWVELRDLDHRSAATPDVRPLLLVTAVNPIRGTVSLDVKDQDRVLQLNKVARPLLQRWEANAGELLVGKPLPLAAGIEIRFQEGKQYHRGDYWLIPARTSAPGILWGGTAEAPEFRPPHNPPPALAPLLFVPKEGSPVDLRIWRS